MTVMDSIFKRARQTPQRIVLSEGEDARVVEGAVRAFREKVATPVLVGNTANVTALLEANGVNASEIAIVDPEQSEHTPAYATAFYQLRKHKGMTEARALETLRHNPLTFAAMMVRQGDADGTIGGAVHTTGDTVLAAFQAIGKAKNVDTVSSFFIMVLPATATAAQRVVLFADCALIIDPSEEELAQIALSSARSFTALTGEEARVAMLSFSTAGSARHEKVTRVSQATSRVKALQPDLLIDGDIQFDAAFVPEVGKSKAPDSALQGNANVFVFPGLESGNIGYKIAQRIGGAEAIGPVLQGLAKPANDLSRGCNAHDVYNLIAVTAVQALDNA